MVVGFLIPKTIFFIGIYRNMLFTGAVLAVAWCLTAFFVTQVRARRINIFAAFTVVMILIRVIVVLASKSPTLYLITQSIDYALCGMIFFVSLLFPRSVIQLFAEASGARMPDIIRNSPYYGRAWRIVTAVWGAVFMFVAVILAILKMGNLSSVAMLDMLAGWPVTVTLIIFTVIFPRWYWTRNIGPVRI